MHAFGSIITVFLTPKYVLLPVAFATVFSLDCGPKVFSAKYAA